MTLHPWTAAAVGAGLALAAVAPVTAAATTPLPTPAVPQTPRLRPQTVAPLPGGLDGVLMVNDNNPELITAPGVLLSTFPAQGMGDPQAHLDVALNGRFDLFSHHVFAGKADSLDATLWLAVLAAPRGSEAVSLRMLAGSTALSQATDAIQPAAPFLPLPGLLAQDGSIFSGPGSRVATELLSRQRSSLLPSQWRLTPGAPQALVVLPIPVRGLDPLLNGRNLQLRLESSGPVSLATLAAFGAGDQPPAAEDWQRLLRGSLSPKEHQPTPRGAKGAIVYSRVSGVQRGSTWRATLTDPGQPWLSASRAPISWPISSLERGRLGSGQVETAELTALYPGTAWSAHGNYGVEYDLTLPLRNTGPRLQRLQLALESPLKDDQPSGGLRFNASPARAVVFRGSVEVTGLDDGGSRPQGPRSFHLVLRSGQQGPALGSVTLTPGAQRRLRVRLVYPADATPPQVLSLLPLPDSSPDSPRGTAPGLQGPVKQSPAPPASSQP